MAVAYIKELLSIILLVGELILPTNIKVIAERYGESYVI
jgi:hypothetical protein